MKRVTTRVLFPVGKRDVCFPWLGVLPANIRGRKRFCPAVDGVWVVQHLLLCHTVQCIFFAQMLPD